MRITNNYNTQSFGSLKVRYSAESNLMKLPQKTLHKLHKFGEYLQDTSFVDMVVEKDLTPVIKGKFQKGGIIPPFEFYKPDSKMFKVKAKYEGEIPYGNIQGDSVELNINMKNYTRSTELYDRFMAARGDFEKAGLLTKLVDNAIDEPNILAKKAAEETMSKQKIVNNIMDDFGIFDK